MRKFEFSIEADNFLHAGQLRQKVYEIYGIKIKQFTINDEDDE